MKHMLLAAGAAALVLSAPVAAHGPGSAQETSTEIFTTLIPNVAGKKLVAREVVYAPAGATPSHTHAASAFIYAYVVSGEIVSAVDDEEPRTYRAGESWHEKPGARHRVSRNASTTKPAKLLAIFILDQEEEKLVFLEGQ